MDHAEFESTKRYVGFDERSAAALADFHALAEPHMSRIIEDFYATIEAHSHTRGVISGGKQQIERLKLTLVAWLESVLKGPHDATLLESHSRIGRVHVRIGLPQHYMFTAMNRIRLRLFEVAQRAFAQDPDRLIATVQAVDQILDLELAIMLDTYREDLAEKIRTAERLATIGQLAASIGHELRNPLGIIESSLFLMRQRLEKLGLVDPQVEKHRDKIARQVKQCGQIITNLLDLARDRPPRRQRVLLQPLVESAIENAGLPKEITVNRQVPAELSIDADPDDFGHVIMNLVANASQAQKGVGTITISAERYKGGSAIYVKDGGPGVPLENRQRIFDALFTTKARGTGLGLALSRRIVQAHGGELGLLPSERGAVFRAWIPDLESAAAGTGLAAIGGKE